MNNSSKFKNKYSAFLFDMDGTLLNSLIPGERVWSKWALSHGLDLVKFLPTLHGARSVDTITNLNLPNVDPKVEAHKITQGEIEDVDGIIEIAGANQFLKSLSKSQWAIVTSAPYELAQARLKAAGIAFPECIVTAENVKMGKPNPDCYLLAAKKLGVDIKDCLVFEDATVGIQAAESAGAEVIVVTAANTHPVNTPHRKISNYTNLKIEIENNNTISIHGL